MASTLAGDVYSRGSVASGSYTCDKNGNLTNDSRRALNFGYNVLNLLSEVKTTGGVLEAKYLYLADGTKLRVRDNGEVNGFDYLGSLTYRKSGAGLQLESASFRDGVIRPGDSNSGQYEVDYFLTDHLGSVRVIVDGTGKVLERNDYYPFGARHERSDYSQLAANRFKYNGKEEQVTGNLKYLDYGARMYDSGLGRWFNIDPCIEDYINQSPYVFVANNLVNMIDTDGRKIIFVNGLLAFGSGEGGRAYWNRNFVNGAQNYFKDYTTPYFTDIDYQENRYEKFSVIKRQQAGYEYAKEYYNELTSGMKNDEAIRLVSHSMGGAFAAGMREYLMERGHVVDYAIYINTYQRRGIKNKDPETTITLDFINPNDPVLGFLDINSSPSQFIEHSIPIRIKSDREFKYIHKGPISSGKEFWDLILLILGEI